MFYDTLLSLTNGGQAVDVVVVTNGSTDGTQETVRRLGGIVDDTDSRIWYGMQRAIEAVIARGAEIVLFTADDITYHPGWADQLAAFWADAPEEVEGVGDPDLQAVGAPEGHEEVQQGEFVTLMGPSGAGKSTLMNIIGMLDEPSAGEYFFFDEPVHKMKERQKSDMHKNYIGFIFQAYHLIDELTVYENIETPLLYKGVNASQRKSMVAELLDRFNMVAKKDLFPEQLSGGQQQLVGIARAIVGQPKLLLADEPTGNLHSEQGKKIMDIFQKLNEEGITIIQVTHSEENALRGKRIVKVVDGTIESDVLVNAK
jgi:ABC-type lipoprotein export system ATPase subunit